MKPKLHGYYRLLYNEYAKTLPFSWHRTIKGADTIPQSYRYKGNVASDYYHHRCEGMSGLMEFAEECNMRIDWDQERLVPVDAPKD